MPEFEDFINIKSSSAKRQEVEQHKRRRELEDFKWILSDKRGRRFIYRLLCLCNVLNYVFHDNERWDAWESGKRYVGMVIQKDIEDSAGFQALDMMRKEDRVLKEQEGRLE